MSSPTSSPEPQPLMHPARPERLLLERLAVSACAVDGVDRAAVGLVHGVVVTTFGASCAGALMLSEKQVRTGVGPLPEALRSRRPVEVPVLPARWSGTRLGQLAVDCGVAGLAAVPLQAAGEVMAVLALYRDTPGRAAPELAGVVARMLRVLSPFRLDGAQRPAVDLATDVVAGTWGLNPVQALVLLRAHARHWEVPLEDVVVGVLERTVVLDPGLR